MDLPPEKAREMKDQLGIPEDFYTAIPPALTLADKRRLGRFHRDLLEEERGNWLG